MTATGLSCSDPELDPDLFIVCIIIARIPNISSLTINDQSTITAILLTEQNRTEQSYQLCDGPSRTSTELPRQVERPRARPPGRLFRAVNFFVADKCAGGDSGAREAWFDQP